MTEASDLDQVHQAIFGLSAGHEMNMLASSFDNVESERRWVHYLNRFIRLTQFNSTPPPPSALSYLVINDHEVAVLYRWRDESTGPGRNPSRALIGSPAVLTVPVALGLRGWPGWTRYAAGQLLRPVPAHKIVQAGQDGLLSLREHVPQLEPGLVKVLATLIEHPERKVGIVGCPLESRVAMMLALYELAPRAADPDYHWDWSFSTHEVLNGEEVRELPMVVFLPGWPDMRTNRSVIDLAGWAEASRDAIDQATLLHRQYSDSHRIEPPARESLPPASPPTTGPSRGPKRAAPTQPAGWYAPSGQRSHHRWDGQTWTGERWEAPTGVFLSYSRGDEKRARDLVADLRAARLSVWFDEDIDTGQVWWDEILHQIRLAAVFVHAISDAALRSVPCRAEREYAERLGLPVVTVLVDDADLRPTSYGTRQLVDYRTPDRRRAARLVADIIRAAQQRAPLPDPLPDPPEAPFGYVLRLADEVDRPRLDRDDQRRLLHELIEHLDGAPDPDVQASVRRLLRKLIEREDIVHSVAVLGQRVLDGAATE